MIAEHAAEHFFSTPRGTTRGTRGRICPDLRGTPFGTLRNATQSSYGEAFHTKGWNAPQGPAK